MLFSRILLSVRLITPLHRVLGTTKEYLELLEGMGIHTVEDLLLYVPRTHEDLSRLTTLANSPLNEKVTIRGTVDQVKLVFTRTRKKLVTARFMDIDGGVCEVIWYNQPHIKRMIADGDTVVLTGKLVEKGTKILFQSPQFEMDRGSDLVHAGKIIPIYPQHENITSKWIREKMVRVRPAISLLKETLPQSVIQEENLLGKNEAIEALHFPQDCDVLQKALDRMAFEEMYVLQVEALKRKQEWKGETQERLNIPLDVELIRSFFASLKFRPTDSQKVAIYEILKDLESEHPMSRLLEGDVGSGKTLVATATIANVIRHGGQCALMVPTEVLARQHAESIAKTFFTFHRYLQGRRNSPSSLHCPVVALLTGSFPKSQADDIRQRVSAGTVDLLIGTHALIEDAVRFKNLVLVIVDEQHRFGVLQRERLKAKGNPHFLSMTATPIPRTLALTAHGHHDLSVLTEKPGKKQDIHTKVVSPYDRKTVELFIDKEIEAGRQVFVICPLIEESEIDARKEIKNVQEECARLSHNFPSRTIAMLHGRMSAQEKEEIMQKFRQKEIDLLVSTSVIEVGIDIPNATIMLIEGSERFGLSQLHQFRGRVGRGEHKGYCFLFTTDVSQADSPRLKAMEDHESGFTLAEIDLQIRGPGELYGLRQSGIPAIRFGGLLNPALVVRARRAAMKALGHTDSLKNMKGLGG